MIARADHIWHDGFDMELFCSRCLSNARRCESLRGERPSWACTLIMSMHAVSPSSCLQHKKVCVARGSECSYRCWIIWWCLQLHCVLSHVVRYGLPCECRHLICGVMCSVTASFQSALIVLCNCSTFNSVSGVITSPTPQKNKQIMEGCIFDTMNSVARQRHSKLFVLCVFLICRYSVVRASNQCSRILCWPCSVAAAVHL